MYTPYLSGTDSPNRGFMSPTGALHSTNLNSGLKITSSKKIKNPKQKLLSVRRFFKSRLCRVSLESRLSQNQKELTSIETSDVALVPKSPPSHQTGLNIGFLEPSQIDTLPPEILSLVFQWLEHRCFESRRPLLWMYVNGVCSRWRAVALQTPVLWAAHIPSNALLAVEFMKRSQGMPLGHMQIISMYAETRPSWYNVVLPELHRTRELYVQSWPGSERTAQVFSNIKKAPMPYLQSLTLYHSPGSHDEYAMRDCLTLLHPLPSLRNIRVGGCGLRIDWERAMLSNITCLELTNIPVGSRPCLKHLLRLFEASPCLKTLLLQDAVERDHESVSQSTIPLNNQLRYLQDVNLHIQSHDTSILLQSMLLSDKTCIYAESDKRDPRNNFRELAIGVQSLIEESPYTVRSVEVFASPSSITIYLCRYEGQRDHWIALQSSNIPYTVVLSEEISHALTALSFTSLQHLELALSHSISSHSTEHWIEIFSPMTSLQTLKLTNITNSPRLLQLLAIPIPYRLSTSTASNHPSEKTFLLPQLQEITIGDQFFGGKVYPWTDSERRVFPSILVHFVSLRSQAATLSWSSGDTNTGVVYQHQLRKLTVNQNQSQLALDPDARYMRDIRELLDEFVLNTYLD